MTLPFIFFYFALTLFRARVRKYWVEWTGEWMTKMMMVLQTMMIVAAQRVLMSHDNLAR